MTKYHSVREVNMICRGERPDWEYLTEDGAWSREHDAAALFDTVEEAEAHCPQGGFLVHGTGRRFNPADARRGDRHTPGTSRETRW